MTSDGWRYLLVGGLIALVAIVGGGAVLGRRLPGPLARLSRTGLGFLLLGVVLSPAALGVFDTPGEGGVTLRQTLQPITALALAWIGVLFGCHLEWGRLKRFAPAWYGVTLLEGALAVALAALAAWGVLRAAGLPAPDVAAAALFCGAAASGTAPTGLFLLRQETRISGPIYERLLFFSTLDDLPGLLLLGVLCAVARPPGAPETLPAWGWLLLALGIGLALAFVLRLGLRPGLDDEHVFLVLLGALGLVAGVCGVLRLSPLVVGLVAGAAFANRSRQKERVYEVLQGREHVLYTLLLVLTGSLVQPGSLALLAALTAALVAARALGKTLGAQAAVPARASLALLPQGGLTIAMVASFAHAYETPAAQVAVAATVAGVLVNDLLGGLIAARALQGLRG